LSISDYRFLNGRDLTVIGQSDNKAARCVICYIGDCVNLFKSSWGNNASLSILSKTRKGRDDLLPNLPLRCAIRTSLYSYSYGTYRTDPHAKPSKRSPWLHSTSFVKHTKRTPLVRWSPNCEIEYSITIFSLFFVRRRA